MFPLAEFQAIGLARPDAGRMCCPAETLGKGEGEKNGWLRPRDRTLGGVVSIKDIGGPYSSGVLVGGAHFEYQKAPPEILAKVDCIKARAQRHRVSMKIELPESISGDRV
jgi:hypothetical protein